MKDIVLFGMPGAGKGTQAELLKSYRPGEYVHLSTGDVFRSLTSTPNAIGDHVKDRIEKWLLIDDKVTMSLFDVYFYSVIADQKHMLLDGYPRSIPQLNAFLTKAHDYEREIIGLYFDLPADEALKRMIARGRDGETPEIIETRLEKYYKFTEPIMNAFASQQKLLTIDASGDIDSIHEEVKSLLDQHAA